MIKSNFTLLMTSQFALAANTAPCSMEASESFINEEVLDATHSPDAQSKKATAPETRKNGIKFYHPQELGAPIDKPEHLLYFKGRVEQGIPDHEVKKYPERYTVSEIRELDIRDYPIKYEHKDDVGWIFNNWMDADNWLWIEALIDKRHPRIAAVQESIQAKDFEKFTTGMSKRDRQALAKVKKSIDELSAGYDYAGHIDRRTKAKVARFGANGRVHKVFNEVSLTNAGVRDGTYIAVMASLEAEAALEQQRASAGIAPKTLRTPLTLKHATVESDSSALSSRAQKNGNDINGRFPTLVLPSQQRNSKARPLDSAESAAAAAAASVAETQKSSKNPALNTGALASVKMAGKDETSNTAGGGSAETANNSNAATGIANNGGSLNTGGSSAAPPAMGGGSKPPGSNSIAKIAGGGGKVQTNTSPPPPPQEKNSLPSGQQERTATQNNVPKRKPVSQVPATPQPDAGQEENAGASAAEANATGEDEQMDEADELLEFSKNPLSDEQLAALPVQDLVFYTKKMQRANEMLRPEATENRQKRKEAQEAFKKAQLAALPSYKQALVNAGVVTESNEESSDALLETFFTTPQHKEYVDMVAPIFSKNSEQASVIEQLKQQLAEAQNRAGLQSGIAKANKSFRGASQPSSTSTNATIKAGQKRKEMVQEAVAEQQYQQHQQQQQERVQQQQRQAAQQPQKQQRTQMPAQKKEVPSPQTSRFPVLSKPSGASLSKKTPPAQVKQDESAMEDTNEGDAQEEPAAPQQRRPQQRRDPTAPFKSTLPGVDVIGRSVWISNTSPYAGQAGMVKVCNSLSAQGTVVANEQTFFTLDDHFVPTDTSENMFQVLGGRATVTKEVLQGYFGNNPGLVAAIESDINTHVPYSKLQGSSYWDIDPRTRHLKTTIENQEPPSYRNGKTNPLAKQTPREVPARE